MISTQMKSIGQRIKQLLKEQGVKQAELAKACGASEQSVSAWIRTGNISKEFLPAVVKKLKTSYSFLLEGSVSPSVTHTDWVFVPTLNMMEATHWRKTIKRHREGTHLKPVRTLDPTLTEIAGPRTFCVQWPFESMTPILEQGDFVFVDPDTPPVPNELVCFCHRGRLGDAYYIREYRPLEFNPHRMVFDEWRNKPFIAHSVTPHWPDMECSHPDGEQYEIIGAVIQVTKMPSYLTVERVLLNNTP